MSTVLSFATAIRASPPEPFWNVGIPSGVAPVEVYVSDKPPENFTSHLVPVLF